MLIALVAAVARAVHLRRTRGQPVKLLAAS
jgi:hypothetical protein